MAHKQLHKFETVYVVGAGFSAGLNFPLVHDLLVLLWPRLSPPQRKKLQKVIKFHHPGFNPKRATSFPSVEQLLSEMMVNDQLFEASRVAEGTFKHTDLQNIRQDLLFNLATWFLEMHREVMEGVPSWLETVIEQVISERAAVISFNWDLILDELLFGDAIKASSYGLGDDREEGPILLKPHGSLNWHRGPVAKFLARNKRIQIYSGKGAEQIHAFRPYRLPSSSKRIYMPLIIPSSVWKDL